MRAVQMEFETTVSVTSCLALVMSLYLQSDLLRLPLEPFAQNHHHQFRAAKINATPRTHSV